MKTCKHYERLISERLGQTLAAERERELEAHLACCEPCRTLADELARAQALLKSLPERETSPQFMSALRARLESVRQPPLIVRRLRAGLRAGLDLVVRPRHAWQPAAVAAFVVVVVTGAFVAAGLRPSAAPGAPGEVIVERSGGGTYSEPLDDSYFDRAHESFRDDQPYAVDAGWRLATYEVDH